MVKLILKAYIKNNVYKNVYRLLPKKKKGRLSKKAREKYQNPSEEEKIKSTNMVVSDKEIF